jgi:hypothetical protein
MERTWLYSFAGAGIGFLVGSVLVQMMAGGASPSETTAITLFVGTFLAGTGAIAGAITGGVAESVKRTEQAREAQGQRGSESETSDL